MTIEEIEKTIFGFIEIPKPVKGTWKHEVLALALHMDQEEIYSFSKVVDKMRQAGKAMAEQHIAEMFTETKTKEIM